MYVIIISSVLFYVRLVESNEIRCPYLELRTRPSCHCEEYSDWLGMSCSISDTDQLSFLAHPSYERHLHSLNIYFATLSKVPSSVFLHFRSNLRSLGISGPRLASVEDNAFLGLGSLTRLYIFETRLGEIPIGAISHLRHLRHLHLVDNKINALNVSLRSFRISVLSLRYNEISTLMPGTLPSTLTDLNLRRNRISRLRGLLRGDFGNLIHLDISKNSITSLNGELEDTPNLSELYADENVIETLDDNCLANVAKLRKLYIPRNRIYEVATGLRGLTSLYYLDLSHNGLSDLRSNSLDDLTSLKTLFLGHNHLRHLQEGLFSCLSSLVYLDLSFNKLGELYSLVPHLILIGSAAPHQYTELVTSNCGLRYNLPLMLLQLQDSGLGCGDLVNQTIRYLQRKGVAVYGNPCKACVDDVWDITNTDCI